jgi:diadenylate cyclase
MMELLRQHRWILDILDISLVSLILYRLLLIIKGTKAAQMLIGLGILLLASLASRYLQLFTVDWIVQSFLAQIVIAIIILFQPEIRRALAHMGEAQFLTFTKAEELKSLEEIVRAAVSLANRRIGGLIVIERDTSLKDFVEVGTLLDAKVSKELLLSIFHPTSPIHDGAVIIKGNRIAAAGCFLPITLSSEVSKALGTRHRAGIGLTEETDAVALIVSEETGWISMSLDGKLETKLDMGTLRDIMTELFTAKKAKK